MKFFKKNNGITLIALVITIIVLLILAGVSIATLTGNNGLLTKANEAKSANDAGAEKEQIELAYNAARIKALTKEDGIVTATNLNDELIANGVTGASVTGSGTIDVTMPSGNVYTIDNNGEIIDWNAIIADATANPDNYKHAGQSTTNGDIGIGTDGKPVNLNLWTYEVINGNEIRLSNNGGSGDGNPGYQNSNIVEGKIIGTVPQYIKISGNSDFYEVTSMFCTFNRCTNLTIAPKIPSSVTDMESAFQRTSLEVAPTMPSKVTNMTHTFYKCSTLTIAPTIPSSVTDMNYTFYECTGLKTAPTIPSGVTDMYGTFSSCTNLQGTLEINANPTTYTNCFNGAATEGTGLVVTGSSTMLDALIATGSDNSNITKGTN